MAMHAGFTTKKPLMIALLLLLFELASLAAWAKPTAISLRAGAHQDKTRLVIELSEAFEFTVKNQENPAAVNIEIPGIDWAADPLGRKIGLIENVRFLNDSETLEISSSKNIGVKTAFTIAPKETVNWRLVIDLEEGGKSNHAVTPSPNPPPQIKKSQPPAKRIVAIDPGHGGIDPGAIGVSGIYEKEITLAISKELRHKLEATGRYTVFLTRENDSFIRLRERFNLARNAGAELFISIHADAIANTSVRGLSVYTLSEKASDAEAAALAERENKVDLIAGIDLSHEPPEVANILIDLAKRETMNLSASFASYAVGELGKEISLLNNSHRFAGFAVLKAQDMPSVLVESGYLSNPREEKLLRQPEYRAKLANALAKGVDRYFTNLKTQKP